MSWFPEPWWSKYNTNWTSVNIIYSYHYLSNIFTWLYIYCEYNFLVEIFFKWNIFLTKNLKTRMTIHNSNIFFLYSILPGAYSINKYMYNTLAQCKVFISLTVWHYKIEIDMILTLWKIIVDIYCHGISIFYFVDIHLWFTGHQFQRHGLINIYIYKV